MFGSPLSVLIVEAKDCGKYAKQLYNLIGSKDYGDESEGSVAGSIEASIFTEKQFASTALSSEQRVVFIGRPKGAEDYIDAIKTEADDSFDEFGIHISLSGKQAFVDVSGGPVDRDSYNAFLSFANEHGQQPSNLLGAFERVQGEGGLADDGTPKNPLEVVGGLLGGAMKAIGGATRVVGSQVDFVLKAGDVEDQKFRFAIRFFYQEKLRDFVGA